MPANSRITLFGLPHTVSVERLQSIDNGRGGVTMGNALEIYASRKCRISTLAKHDEELKKPGFDMDKARKVTMVYSPAVELNDHVSVPWGTPPNMSGPSGLGAFMPTTIVIGTPAGSQTLTWSKTRDRYEDSITGDYIVYWTSSVWKFEDAVAPLTYEFTGFTKHQNIFKQPWATVVGASYSVTSQAGVAQTYQVVWLHHQLDDRGHMHHTTLVMELI